MNPEDQPREPVGTTDDQWLPVGRDGYGAPIYAWQTDGKGSD